MLKRIFSLILVLTMLAGYMPPLHVHAEEMENAEPYVAEATAVAEETTAETEQSAETTGVDAEVAAEPTQPETVPEETAAPTEEPEEVLQFEEFVYTSEADFTSEELYEAYAANLFFGNSFSFFGTAAGEMLTGDEKLLYDALTTFIKQVACGQRAAATISIGQELSGYPVDIEVTFTGTGFTSMQLGRVLDALMADLPFEFYWYEKTSGCTASKISTGSSLLQIILGFNVADNYNTGDPFTADIAKTGAAAQSVARVKDIVDAYASKSDYEKLVGYKEEICDLVNYNWDAAWDNVFSTDIDPWQLIHVFDGNPETRVVCEGYSKAFQYLCDLTDFKGDVTCYAVTGLMDGGGHMWNIVSINDVNYFADVTNSDSDSIGYDGSLFLAGASGSVAAGYTVSGIEYTYHEDTKVLWGAGEDSILNLSPVKYTPPTAEEEDEPVASGTCGENLIWELDDAGTLTISGTGAMDDYYAFNDPPVAPWDAYKEQIVSVVIGEGVTETGAYAFGQCFNLTSVTLPSSLLVLGQSTFWECGKLTEIALPSNLQRIEHEVFLYCMALTSIVIPASVTEIVDRAFGGNRNLTGIWVEAGNTAYCNDSNGVLFTKDMTKLVAVPASLQGAYAIPASVTDIGSDAFSGCSDLTNITLPSGLTEIGSRAFSECYGLTTIEIPAGVTAIGAGAFRFCGNLTSIEIPASVTSIEQYAFYSCDNLKDVYYGGNEAQWQAITIGGNNEPILYTVIHYNCTNADHHWVAGSVEATCTQDGYTYESCACGYMRNLVITGYAPGHKEVTDVAVAPTCTETGLTEGKRCAVCNEVLVAQTVIDALGHTEVIDEAVAATCTATGLTEGKHCSACNEVLIAQTVVDALGHKYESVVTVPTCTDDGYTTYTCSACDDTYVADEVAALGHTVVTDAAVAPTCTETGLTEGEHCSVCNEVLVAQEVVDALGHAEVIDEAVAATCTETGLTEGKHCSACNEVLVEQETVAALGHIEVTDAAIAPACTETGLTEGKHCSVCNEVLVAQETVDALGHAEVIDEAIAPTCTETGLTEGKHCDRCGEIYVAQEVIPALGHEFAVQNGEIVCAVCGETVTIHIHQDYVALDIYENPQVQLYVDIAPANLTADLSWSAEGNDGILQFDQNGLITALRAGTAYAVAELTVDGYTISSRCRVDVTENVQILGIQLSTDKVTTELYKDEFATFEILLDLPQNRPFTGDELIVTDEAAMSASGLENKSNLIESVQFKTISDLFELVLLDDRTVQIVPTQKAMESGKTLKSSYTDTVIVKIKGEEEPRKEELKLTLSVKKTQPKPKAKINAFNSFYEGQSQEIIITGVDVTGIRANENVATPIPNWLTLEDGCLKLNGNTPKSSDKAYLWVDVEGFRYPAELTLTVKHTKKAPTLKFAKSSVTLNKAAEQQVEVAVTSSDAAYVIDDPEIRVTGGKMGDLEASYSNGILTVTTTEKTPDMGTYTVYLKTPGCKEVAVTVKVTKQEPSVSYKAATLDLSFPETAGIVVPTFKNYSGGFEIEDMTAKTTKGENVDFFQVEKDGKNILVTCDADIPTGSYNLTVKLKLDDGRTINGTAKVSVKRTAVKLKVSTSKVSLNKELPDQAVVEVSCTTKNYKFDLNDAVLTYDDKMLDIERAGNALIIKLKDGAEYGKTYPVSVSADYKGAPVVKLNVAVLKKGSVVKSTIKATGTLDVIREGTAITVKPTYTNYLNVNVDEDSVLKIYSSKDNYETAIAEVYAENGIFTIDGSIIGNHTLKYKAQLETKIPGKTDPIKSNQINLSVKMGAAKLTAKSSGTTLFAKDRNDRALVWFEAAAASLNDVKTIQIKDAKYKDVFEIIDYRDGSFAIAFKDGKIHESIAKQLEKKSSVSITLNLNVFIDGNASTKANATQKVNLTIVK